MKQSVKKWLSIMLTMVVVASFVIQPIKVDAAFDLAAESAILVDGKTGKIIYSKNIDAILPTASMTKMMSEYLILEAINDGKIQWEQQVPISDFVRNLSLYTSLSNVPLRQDETYTVKELYQSVAIYSANASTIALAELISGSETAFVKMMNDKAAELGLEDYEFVNSTGLNNSDLQGNHPDGTGETAENMMSARATAKLAFHLINDYPEVLETASIPTLPFRASESETIEMRNWNWMLPGLEPQHDYDGIDGLKTGYTSAAGNAFTGTAVRNGMRLISVVMRTGTRDDRFNETRKLLDYGFNHFSHLELVNAGFAPEGSESIAVASGKEREVAISSVDSLSTVVKNGDEELYTSELILDENVLNENGELEAPFEAGTEVGSLVLVYGGEQQEEFLYPWQRAQVSVVTDTAVEKAGWFSMTMRAIGGFFSGIWNGVADTVKGWF
ncbi:D-alanyl-D-alanine carboxypeptidase family protein [Halalkalibacter akibai]|uniref:serine-type D-Ala-D-Ala carboxypeptidase n=1 Tax=Halalkalibacter akibai (strain ATCC 43226 / DSM 21942 / CIP 109018 / JCM 9157 / 1139) TaxID=1236973 RepID=W4QYM1_HALA3|nr:D-alanyl-D-alanine carboxypeptidase family protein [Halalkalibacter akibai]GAE37245.1 D-alanyl-D-alanine carboxypeptidase [Halalkalibacter akibai JCM 9157]